MQGITTVTLVVVVITGILTSVLGPVFLKMIGIKDPVAIGLSLGGTGHAVGTGAAFRYGQVAGAMGGLSIAVNRDSDMSLLLYCGKFDSEIKN